MPAFPLLRAYIRIYIQIHTHTLYICTYIYVHIYMYIYIYVYIHTYIYLSIHPSISISIYLSICLYLSIYTYLYIENIFICCTYHIAFRSLASPRLFTPCLAQRGTRHDFDMRFKKDLENGVAQRLGAPPIVKMVM